MRLHTNTDKYERGLRVCPSLSWHKGLHPLMYFSLWKSTFWTKAVVGNTDKTLKTLNTDKTLKKSVQLSNFQDARFSWLPARASKIIVRFHVIKVKSPSIILTTAGKRKHFHAIRLLWMKHLTLTGNLKPHATRVEWSWIKQRGYMDGF